MNIAILLKAFFFHVFTENDKPVDSDFINKEIVFWLLLWLYIFFDKKLYFNCVSQTRPMG